MVDYAAIAATNNMICINVYVLRVVTDHNQQYIIYADRMRWLKKSKTKNLKEVIAPIDVVDDV